MNGMPPEIKRDMDKIIKVADDLKMTVYIVGGFPRDIISGEGITNDTDLDLTEENGNAFDLAFFVAAKYKLPEPTVYEASGTSMVTMSEGRVVEFHNAYFDVPHILDQLYVMGVEPTSLNKDIYARDFTINTLLYEPKEEKILDLTGFGISDIKNKILRTPIDPMKTLGHSPKRVLRGLRFKVEMGLTPTPEYEEAEKYFIPTLASYFIQKPNSDMVSKTLKKMFAVDPERAYSEFEKLGLLSYLPRVEGMDEIARQRIFSFDNSWYKTSGPTPSENKEKNEVIPGGFSSGKPDSDFDPEQLKKGIKVELEHTNSKDMAKEIAKDHLVEDPKYYDHLEEMEAKYVKDKKCGNSVLSEEVGVGPRIVADNDSWYKISKIKKLPDGKWRVTEKDGTGNLGTFDTEEEAKKRIGEVEYFKKKNAQKDELPTAGEGAVLGLPQTQESGEAKMVRHLLDEREKHRAYIRRKRNEDKRDTMKTIHVFEALNEGDHDKLDSLVKDKKVKDIQNKNRITG